MFENEPRILCADGISLSVQANEYAYCTPRVTGAEEYSKKEVGFIFANEDFKPFPAPNEWLPYAEDSEKGSFSDVFAYVPVELIEAFIESHGGRKGVS